MFLFTFLLTEPVTWVNYIGASLDPLHNFSHATIASDGEHSEVRVHGYSSLHLLSNKGPTRCGGSVDSVAATDVALACLRIITRKFVVVVDIWSRTFSKPTTVDLSGARRNRKKLFVM